MERQVEGSLTRHRLLCQHLLAGPPVAAPRRHTSEWHLIAAVGNLLPETCADVDDLMRDTSFRPATSIAVGIRRFVDWYRTYHGL